MFSEYASRFLAQSQSRISNFAGQTDHDDANQHNASDWPSSRPGRHRTGAAGTRSFLSRGYGGGAGNPYQQNGTGSRFGNIAFAASRISAAHDAPLFHGALDEFREEDDEAERDREAADLFALQRSRRVAAASKLAESTESEGHSRASLDDDDDDDDPYRGRTAGRGGRGIKSSWNGTRSGFRHNVAHDTLHEEAEEVSADATSKGRAGKAAMVDVGLESQDDDDGDDEPPESLLGDTHTDSSPPPFQRFKQRSAEQTPFLRRSSTDRSEMSSLQQDDPMQGQPMDAGTGFIDGETFRHDPFFAWIFLISFAAMLSTFVLVWLHTSPRSGPVGDTIYATLQRSFHMLAVDTVVAVFVSLVWLAALRSFARPLVSVILVAVPVVMFSFSLYAFISSFKGRTHGASLQDAVMRWLAIIPGAACLLWLWVVSKSRRAIRQAVEILQFSSRILAQNPALLIMGFACLALIIVWTWAWLVMFTRVFMGGYFSKSLVRFVIQLSSWWLGAAFVFMYMWTMAVVNAVHRATTAATVSQWYFHRNAAGGGGGGGAAPSSRDVVMAALGHAVTTIFGSVCQSTLLSLLVRAPLLFLPRRIGAVVTNVAAFWIPTPVVALTNPLTVTYAAIHSQGLATAARGLDQMELVTPAMPTTTLTPRAPPRGGAGLLPYRLAKLLLVATRLLMATALGFGGWVVTAKQLRLTLPDGVGVRGSAYAYVVGLMAGFIGYSVMGAMEGVLSGIVDAVLVCYGSERRMEMGHGRFCLEAAYLFGERRPGGLGDDDDDHV